MKSLDFDYHCPYCDKNTIIFVEFDSNTEYYPTTECEHCGLTIKEAALEEKIAEEVQDYYIGAAEYYGEDR